MLVFDNPKQKPYYVGQLLQNKHLRKSGLSLVLEFRWDSAFRAWKMRLLRQKTGRIFWSYCESYLPLEEKE
jgi:hypothetical protein